MFTPLFAHTWISKGVDLSQSDGEVWQSLPHVVSLAKHFIHTQTCDTVALIMLTDESSGMIWWALCCRHGRSHISRCRAACLLYSILGSRIFSIVCFWWF